ncbi:protein translocase subunit SecD [Limibaculum sp. M0105]|uniref:Multifunctional fusion protein n=1 Tax=Thermohalobaculum xanthum TaxID=2753746 RepID=A0A8J7M411_9RHOB|nr:protein translocase subunit SecD [Thermohalobaculum xanthum]MBK0397808.1 protein translocase subunit SecD [Thermohalobaculum xanthum]
MLYFPLWKKIWIIGLCVLGILFALPNLATQEMRDSIPDWLPRDSVNLGLDLRGGAHLLVEVQVGEVEADRMEALRADVRQALIDADVRRFTGLRAAEDHVSVRITNADDMARALEALRALAQPVTGLLGTGLPGMAAGSDLEVTDSGDQTLRIGLTEPAIAAMNERTMAQSLEIVRRRIDESGTREPTIQRQGEDRILVQVPGIGSAEELLGLIGRTAKLTFHAVKGIGAEAQNPGPGEMVLNDATSAEPLLLERRAILTGDQLVDSQLGFHPDTGLPVVNFRFDSGGARIFGNYTAANVGQLFAIVLDNEVITAPRIQSPILGGSGFIEGNFTVESATELSILLRSGALPASIKVLEQRTVGPDLGADSIAKGEVATALAFAAVIGFMLLVYRIFGVFACVALVVNVALIMGVLSAIGATLTLPGIAGIVLTIGMAVDANVLIFERIREELRRSKGVSRAIEKGYSEAFSAIIDANITTLIAAVILFAIGSGPVKGFAVTLGIGIVTSVFTAVLLTRLMISMWLERARPKTLQVERFRLVPDETHLHFMKMRRACFGVSVAGVVVSLGLLVAMGLNFGIDFRGGTMIEFRTAQEADLGAIRSEVSGLGIGDVQVQSFGTERDVLVRVEAQGADGDERMAVADAVGDRLTEVFEGGEVRRVEVVGPKVSGELLEAGILAIVLAVTAVLVYIWLRFEWQFGVGAVIALVHDVALTIGVFALVGIEFNLSIIAALLAIVGYSLNDTVVVYDRVRENLRKYKKMDLAQLLDLSVNETLSRTLMTSLTTLVALVAMFLLGPQVIQGFTFAMIWGIVIGTYSSIFVAAALLLSLKIKRDWTEEDPQKAGVQFGSAEG